jgi:hypothetical protein
VSLADDEPNIIAEDGPVTSTPFLQSGFSFEYTLENVELNAHGPMTARFDFGFSTVLRTYLPSGDSSAMPYLCDSCTGIKDMTHRPSRPSSSPKSPKSSVQLSPAGNRVYPQRSLLSGSFQFASISYRSILTEISLYLGTDALDFKARSSS